MKKINKKFGITIVITLVLLLISINLFFLASMTFLQSLRVVFGSVYLLFLPGFLVSFIFFPQTRKFEKGGEGIDWLERLALSIALSIAIVPLAVYYLHLIGMRISALSTFFTVLGICIISAGFIYWRNRSL